MLRNPWTVVWGLFALAGLAGCSTTRNATVANRPVETRHGVVFTQGKPRPVIDGIGWVWGIPKKILLWDRRVENHLVSETTEESIAQYLSDHQLQDVHVRVNEYDPIGEWSRLRGNTAVSPGWRYTVGAIGWVGYTLFPGRLFGGDQYNPYSNSLYVYSDVPSIGIVESAYANDVHSRKLPGTYAVTQEFPLIGMYKETLATREALDYLGEVGLPQEIDEGYRILHPRYGMQAGGAIESIVSASPVFQVSGAVIGHATGRWQARNTLENSPNDLARREKGLANEDTTVRAQDDPELAVCAQE